TRELTEAELSGPAGEVVARIEALSKAGSLAGYHRVKLTTVDGQATVNGTSVSKPYVSGTTVGPRGDGGPGGFGGKGIAQRSIAYQPVGTTVRVNPRVGTGNAVTV